MVYYFLQNKSLDVDDFVGFRSLRAVGIYGMSH